MVEPVSSAVEPGLRFAGATKPEIQKTCDADRASKRAKNTVDCCSFPRATDTSTTVANSVDVSFAKRQLDGRVSKLTTQ